MRRLVSVAPRTPLPGSRRYRTPRSDHSAGRRSGKCHSPAKVHRTSGTNGNATSAATITSPKLPRRLPTAEVPCQTQVCRGENGGYGGDEHVYGHRDRTRGEFYVAVLVVRHDGQDSRVGFAEQIGNLEGTEGKGEDYEAGGDDAR